VSFISVEEAQKKLNLQMRRIELDSGDRLAVHEETRDGLMNILERVEALEERSCIPDVPNLLSTDDRPQRSETRQEVDNNAALMTMFERRMGDMSEKVERVVQDSIDLHQTSTQFKVQLSSLRTHLETREEQMRKLTERVESSDLDSRLEQLRRTFEDERGEKVGILEKIAVFSHRLDDQELSVEGLRSRHDQLVSSQQMTPIELTPDVRVVDSLGLGVGGRGTENGLNHEDYTTRLESAEARIAAINADLSALRESTDFGPRVGALVSQLTDIVPKVIQHEHKMNDFTKTCQNHEDSLSSMKESHALLQAEMKQVSQTGTGGKAVEVDMQPALTSVRDEIAGVAEVMRHQAHQSLQAAQDLAEARSELDWLRKGQEKTVTKEELATATTFVKTSLQEICRDEDSQLRSELLKTITRSVGEVRDSILENVGTLKQPQGGDVSELRAQLESLRCEFERHRGDGSRNASNGELPEELVKALQQDEDIERETQQKLLTRIDELCDRIAAVDSAVAAMGQRGSG